MPIFTAKSGRGFFFMNWINIQTITLRSPQFIGSDPIARGTWLSVLGHCYEQENGGIINDCASWKDRQWQQICGVTLEEINGAGLLMQWSGGNLIVSFYPTDMEEEIKRKRQAGRKGGQARTQAKIEAAQANGAKHNPSTTQAQPKQEPNVIVIEKKGKEIEKKTEAAPVPVAVFFPANLNTPEFSAAWNDWTDYRAERKLARWKPRTVAAKLAELEKWGVSVATDAIRQSIRNGWQGIFEPKTNGQPKKPGGVSTYEQEAKAHGYTL